MKALIVGYGNMGREIEAALLQRGHGVVACYGRGDRSADGGRTDSGFTARTTRPSSGVWARSAAAAARQALSFTAELPACDVAFEFTEPSAAPRNVPFLLSKRVPVVSGTTGWDIADAVQVSAELGVAFLHASNFSIGVAALRRAAAAAAATLAPFRTFHPGILERHHSGKKDAPSGTAKVLAADVTRASGRREIPIVSLRQGGAPGEHVLYFEGVDETLELVHRARSRALFAHGAVSAAEWMLASKANGPLTIDDFFADVTRRGDPS